MTAKLPSDDDFTVDFSTEFCQEFDLHKYCGRPNEPCGGYSETARRCSFCPQRGSSGGKSSKNKRTFDDMFRSLNRA